MNNALLNRITFNPDQCGGKPCVRNMRIRVSDVISLLANGMTTDEVLKEMPDLSREDVQACLLYAAKKIDHPVIHAA